MTREEKAATSVPVADLLKADAFVQAMTAKADAHNPYPLWHGWALRDAFLAGMAMASSGGPVMLRLLPSDVPDLLNAIEVCWNEGQGALRAEVLVQLDPEKTSGLWQYLERTAPTPPS